MSLDLTSLSLLKIADHLMLSKAPVKATNKPRIYLDFDEPQPRVLSRFIFRETKLIARDINVVAKTVLI